MQEHRVLLGLWVVVIAVFAYGWLATSGASILLAQFTSMLLAVITVRRTEVVGQLRFPFVYRATLVLLLIAAATVVVAAGSTVIFVGTSSLAGLIVLASTNLALGIFTWKALVNPRPRYAALVGTLAVIAELAAMLVDIVINFDRTNFVDKTPTLVAFFTSFIATWLGALVCMASLAAFEAGGDPDVPTARIVDDK